MDNLKCSKCGKEVLLDASFCPYCGCPLSKESNNSNDQPTNISLESKKSNIVGADEFAAAIEKVEKTRKKKQKIIIIISLIAFLLLLGLILLLFLGSNLTNKNSKKISLELPDTPLNISNFNYNNVVDKTISVENISYNSSGEDITIYLSIKMISNYTNSNSTYSTIGYKLYDTTGNVVASGNITVKPIGKGEDTTEKLCIYDLDIDKAYKLELLSTK